MRSFTAVAIMLTLGGCVRVESSQVVTGQTAAAHAGDVRVIMEGQEAPAGYNEVAIVEAHGNGYAGMPDVLARLRDDARLLGANAVINVRVDQGTNLVSATGVAVRY